MCEVCPSVWHIGVRRLGVQGASVRRVVCKCISVRGMSVCEMLVCEVCHVYGVQGVAVCEMCRCARSVSVRGELVYKAHWL